MIVVDIREACSDSPTGKALWTRHFVNELLTRSLHIELLAQRDHPWLMDKPVAQFPGMHATGIRWHWHAMRAAITRRALYVSPTSYIVPAFAPKHLATVSVVHDLIAFRREPHALKPTLIERATLPFAVRRSRLLCTVSEATKHDLIERYPRSQNSTLAIGSGPVDDAVFGGDSTPFPNAIVCIGTLSPRKNQLRLIEAHKRLPVELRERHPLVLVGGRGWGDANIVAAAERTPFVHWTGFVAGEDLGSLLSCAAVVAYPSLYEGFGMPLLTAFRRGIPVLTTDRGSLREVAGDAALTVDPLSSDAIAAGLLQLLNDERLRNTLRERGKHRVKAFSWSTVVDKFIEALRARRLIAR